MVIAVPFGIDTVTMTCYLYTDEYMFESVMWTTGNKNRDNAIEFDVTSYRLTDPVHRGELSRQFAKFKITNLSTSPETPTVTITLKVWNGARISHGGSSKYVSCF
jgi:hypothetical protein